MGCTQRLPRLVGKGHAMELLLGGNSLSAKIACKIGLVNKVFKQEDLIPEAIKLAGSIAKNAPLAVKGTIKAINDGFDTDIYTGLQIEQKIFSQLFSSEDTKEGLAAFINKRRPEFKNK